MYSDEKNEQLFYKSVAVTITYDNHLKRKQER